MEKFRQHKSTRFEMDQVRIESLEQENIALKFKLQKAVQKKEDLYLISIEYQRLCEDEIKKSQLLIKEIERLNQELQEKNKEFLKTSKLNLYIPDFSVFDSEKLIKAFETCAEKFDKYKGAGLDFRGKIIPKKFDVCDLETVILKLLKVVEKWIPVISASVHKKDVNGVNGYSSHKKYASCGDKAFNPLFKSPPQIVIKRPPRLVQENSDIPESMRNSKDFIKYCSDTIESGCVSNRSTYSSNTGKSKVRVFRREKSVSQLV